MTGKLEFGLKVTWDRDRIIEELQREHDEIHRFHQELTRKHLQSMKKGDSVFFYHTGEEKQVVGIAEVIKEAYPDKTAKEGEWFCVDLKAVAPFKTPVTLANIRKDAKLKDMVLVNNARLSVQPVTDAEWKHIAALGGVKG